MPLHLCTYGYVPPLYPSTYRCVTDRYPQCNSHSSAVRRYSFDPKAVRVGFVADKVTLGQVFLRALPFYAISIIPPIPQFTLALNPLTQGHRVSTNRNEPVQHSRLICLSAIWQRLCPLRYFFGTVPFFVIGLLFLSSFFLSIFPRYSPRWKRVNSLRLQTA